MAVRSSLLVAALVSCGAAVTALAALPSSGGAAGDHPLGGPAGAFVQAERRPNPVVQYEVFGDSITAGLGVPAHLTWVAGVSYHLAVTERGLAEHRFRNHAVDGQSIATPSPIAVDPSRATLLAGLRRFLEAPPGSTPIAQRRFVITPSVNELIVSDQGSSSSARVTKAVDGTRQAVELLLRAGVPTSNIVVLPMPPVGVSFASTHDATAMVDAPLAAMIASVNRELAGLLTLGRYPRLDPEDDGLADSSLYDDWRGPDGRRSPDGLHLDADGHALLATEIEPLFGTR